MHDDTSAADRRRWIAVAILCVGQLMIILDATIVNVALPAIQTDLDFSPAGLTWVVNAYLLAFASLLMLAGRLGDLVGRKKVFLSGLALFTLASVLCGVSSSQEMLIGARFVQGIGGAVASSVIIAIIVTEFTGARERLRAMSMFTFVAVAGGSIGLLAGGVLTQAISWHWIFFINVPIGVAVLVSGARLIGENPGIGLREGVDAIGSVLITAAMVTGVYAIVTAGDHGWGSTHTLGLGAVAIALLAAFLVQQERSSTPLMPLRILRTGSVLGANLVLGFLVVGMFTTFYLGVLYMQRVLGYGAVDTGLAFLPLTVCIGGMSLGITARLVERVGFRRVYLTGIVLDVAGLALFTRVPADASYVTDLLPAMLLLGVGNGLAFMPLTSTAMAGVPSADAGIASGLVNVTQQVSAAIGVAVLGTLAASRTDDLLGGGARQAEALLGGYHLGFLIAALSVALGGVVAVVGLRRVETEAVAEGVLTQPA